MAHLHPCDDCDVWFHCEELEIDTEDGGRCSVEPARCPDCEQNANEAAYERMLDDFYGGSGPVTLTERMSEAYRTDRGQK